MGMKLIKMAQEKDDNYPVSIPQWVNYNVEKMKSDTIIYSMLLASTCLLYSSRYGSGKPTTTDEQEDSASG
jgi:hypothetical protein